MEQTNKDKQPDGLYFTLALIFGVLTGLVISESIVWAVLGGIIGLLVAGLYLNVFVKGRHH